MKTIRLYGKLGALFGRVHRFSLDSNTVSEAMAALMSQHPTLGAFLTGAKDRGMAFTVFVGKTNIGKEGLHIPTGDEDIRIAPILMGAKQGGIFQIILGVILVVVGAYATALGISAPLGVAMVEAGWGMIIGGVVQLLTPVPKGLHTKESAASTPSYAFSGVVNTQAQGNPKPLLYGGPMKVGSAVIGAGITTEDYTVAGPIGGNGHMGFKQIGASK